MYECIGMLHNIRLDVAAICEIRNVYVKHLKEEVVLNRSLSKQRKTIDTYSKVDNMS